MEKIDVFAHVLLPKYYKKMLELDGELPKKYPFINHPHLTNIDEKRKFWDGETKQIISYVNINPEDYVEPKRAADLCREANEELKEIVTENKDMYHAGVGMIPLNNIEEALLILEEIKESGELCGVQLFTRALGKSIADTEYRRIFEKCNELNLAIWLHPIFDIRKPDNNIVFSWEYELSQAMLQIVEENIFQDYPNLKIIIHHAGAMIPFFEGRINNILPKEQATDFKKFYVDTAILGNTKALELTMSYFGADKVLFGTDAPLGVAPAGATKEIIEAIENMDISKEDKEKIFYKNIENILN